MADLPFTLDQLRILRALAPEGHHRRLGAAQAAALAVIQSVGVQKAKASLTIVGACIVTSVHMHLCAYVCMYV